METSIDQLLVKLIENIRNEIWSLNDDFHTLEVNLRSIELVDQKTDTLKEMVVNLQQKTNQLETLINQLKLNTVNLSDLKINVKDMENDINDIKLTIVSINSKISNLEKINTDESNSNGKRNQFLVGLLMLVIGAIVTMITDLFK